MAGYSLVIRSFIAFTQLKIFNNWYLQKALHCLLTSNFEYLPHRGDTFKFVSHRYSKKVMFLFHFLFHFLFLFRFLFLFLFIFLYSLSNKILISPTSTLHSIHTRYWCFHKWNSVHTFNLGSC